MQLQNTSLITNSYLKAYYKFEGNSNDTTANAHNGTDTTVSYGNQYGKFLQGAYYNGSGYTTMSDSADFKPTSTYSVNVWIKCSSVTSAAFFSSSWIQTNPNNGYYGLELWITGGKPRVIHYYTTSLLDTITTTSTIDDGKWHMVTYVYASTTEKIYIDGVLDSTTSSLHNPAYGAQNYIYMGSRSVYNAGGPIAQSDNYTGTMDELAFFNGYALSQSEIDSLYGSPFPGCII